METTHSRGDIILECESPQAELLGDGRYVVVPLRPSAASPRSENIGEKPKLDISAERVGPCWERKLQNGAIQLEVRYMTARGQECVARCPGGRP